MLGRCRHSASDDMIYSSQMRVSMESRITYIQVLSVARKECERYATAMI